jgi:hypothetical protein
MMQQRSQPGLTLTSVMACLLGMLAMGMLIQYSDITVAISFASEHTLALPAIWTFAALSALCGVFFVLFKWRLLTRAELLCVMFCMLISAPLMTQGFWHRVVAIVATNPRAADFDKLDAMNDKLWPHGPNLIGDAFNSTDPALKTEGDCRWDEVEYEEGKRARLPILVNPGNEARSAIRLRLPVGRNGAPGVVPGEQYIVSVLARATDLGPLSRYSCRVYHDAPGFTEFFSSAVSPKVSFLHRKGFQRVGAYGVKFPATTNDHYVLEFGLQGNGRVELWDSKLFNVAALETLFKGKLMVSESEAAALPESERANLLIKPDNMWSLKGAAFLLGGYIPLRDWAGPVLVWTLFVVLILTATLAINIIMRRQWLDNERFQLPVTRIPVTLMDDEGAEDRSMPAIWTNRMMYIGFAVTLVWMLLKAWHAYNPNVPDLEAKVYLRDYFSSPSWGQTWNNVRFEIDAIFLPMCIFMELNVLLSLVVGYALFRSQLFIGEVTGLNVDPNFPHSSEQIIGAYLGYAVILIVLSWKYLWHTVKAAVTGDRAASEGEALSYRSAYLLLALAVGGSALWARWLGIASGSMVVFFVFIVTIGFVAARIRSECGTPWGYFAPWNLALFLGLLGGVWRFGPEAVMFCYLASFMLAPTVFFLIPGAQMELLGLGRRWNVRPKHLVICAMLGAVGGMLIGGWVFLSNAYALSGDASRYQWAFDNKWWYFFQYNQEMGTATSRLLGQSATAGASTGFDPAWIAFGGSAALAMVVTILRQFFSGFWFHPVGVVIGGTDFMNYIWGSALTAWVIRSIVLRLGGAATVRNKLQPFFVGVFLGGCSAYLVLLVHAAYLRSLGLMPAYNLLTP